LIKNIPIKKYTKNNELGTEVRDNFLKKILFHN